VDLPVSSLRGDHLNQLQHSYSLSAETLEPLAWFVGNLPSDSDSADEGFPGLNNRDFFGSFSTNHSICSAKRAWQAGMSVGIFHFEAAEPKNVKVDIFDL